MIKNLGSTSGGGSGTVTSVSVVSANGLAGTVATPTATPAITLSTTITGLLAGNGTAISAASLTGDASNSGQAITVTALNGTSLAGLATGILKNTTATGAPSIAAAGTDYVSPVGLTTTLASPPAIGGSAAAAGSFTTLSASSTVSGTGFSTYLASPPAIGGTAPAALHATALTSVPAAAPTRDAGNVGFVLSQTGLAMILPPSGFFANNGVLVIGQTPAATATATFSATSGAGVTMTLSSTDLLGTAADVGRVLTILDTTYKYATITTQLTTATATVTISGGTLSGVGPFANSVIWLSGSPTTNTTANSVPLGAVYANAYMYFPAGAIVAAGAAGFYFVQMASTTEGIVYNNVYTSGTPTVPGSPTAFSTTGPGAYAQTTGAPVTAITASLAGNTLGVNGELAVDTCGSNNNSAGNKQILGKYGGTTLGGGSVTTGTSSIMVLRMRNRGIANAQSTSTSLETGNAFIVANAGPSAIDSTGAQNAAITLQLTTATDYFVLESYSIKVFPN